MRYRLRRTQIGEGQEKGDADIYIDKEEIIPVGIIDVETKYDEGFGYDRKMIIETRKYLYYLEPQE